ncbi:MAG: DNA polymerase/3'-5' exonuclease PolX [Syntrophomonadaceae bacterium]|jgi:DNA polymerase (family 10)
MTNREVATILERIADIMQIKEDNSFKVRAYRQAAQSVYHLDEDIRNLYAKNRLNDIPGVGKAIEKKIADMIEKGYCELYERLKSEVPPGVLDMLAIPGLGHKTVKLIYNELGISNLDDLLQAAQQKKIRALPGLGGKTEYNIKKGIELLNQTRGKVTLGLAYPAAQRLRDYLLSFDWVEKAEITGSVRRGKPLVGDIDILVVTHHPERIKEKIINYRDLQKILIAEDDHIKGVLRLNIEFEVIIVSAPDYYAKLLWTTGSSDHRNQLVDKYNFNINDFTGTSTEQAIYEQLNLAYIPPELRENKGELEAAEARHLPQLINLADIKGDLHVHSDWSDGAHKIQEMVEAARLMNYSYLAITDHSKSLPISGGLNEVRLAAQCKVIDEINNNSGDIFVFKGIEVDILRDGQLDFESDILDQLDIVVASVHSNFKLDREKQTQRIIKAIRNPHVNIIGHLSGRLLNRRSGYEIDTDKILHEALVNNVALEINSHPDRLDIDEDIARKARDMGVKIAINSDAHDKNDLRLQMYGVINARRGWLEKNDVINTWDKATLMQFLKKK